MPSTVQRLRLALINFYPPFLGAGIRATQVNAHTTRVTLSMNIFNRNIYGTHFGGSLYAMCDPWFALILFRALGGGYEVWDKAANIQFVRPGRGTVTATFHIPAAEVERVRALAASGQKVEPIYTVDVMDANGEVVARVEKVLHVRRKP